MLFLALSVMSGLYLMAYVSQSGTYISRVVITIFRLFRAHLTFHFSLTFTTAETRAGSEYFSKYHMKK
jgi:hypothetical protein